MLESQIDQEERRRTLQNDVRVKQQREQASTLHQHAQAQADEINQGRFAAMGTPNVTGQSAVPYSSLPKMPDGNPWAGPDLVGDEPPLGFDNPELDLSTVSGGSAEAPTTGSVSPGLSVEQALGRLLLTKHIDVFEEPTQWTIYSSPSPPNDLRAGRSATRSTGEK
jgi:hypothetical protein